MLLVEPAVPLKLLDIARGTIGAAGTRTTAKGREALPNSPALPFNVKYLRRLLKAKRRQVQLWLRP
jgi:hypothetical protein